MTKNYERSKYYYEYDRNDPNRPNPFIRTTGIQDDGFLPIPHDLLEITGWQEGDELQWTDQGDGSFTLRKVNKV